MTNNSLSSEQLQLISEQIPKWADELGFQQCGIVDPDLSLDFERLQSWLKKRMHGDMSYLESHADLRSNPYMLVPGSCRIVSVRMNYMPPEANSLRILKSPDKAYIARYTLGRDYHKTMRKRLTQLGKKIESEIGRSEEGRRGEEGFGWGKD